MQPKIIAIEPTVKKESGQWNLDIDKVQLPEGFKAQERAIISIPPGKYGGNHKHPRTEVFVGLSEELELVWLDESHNLHTQPMKKGEQLFLILIPPHLPHAVVNKSNKQANVLLEYVDGIQRDVEMVKIV